MTDERDRWAGVARPYTTETVTRLRGSLRIEHTLARRGAERLWALLHTTPLVSTPGAATGHQAVQIVRAGLPAIHVSARQVAADASASGQAYPDQRLYPADSVPAVVQRINRALQRADQTQHAEAQVDRDWFAPIVADAEAGSGGALNAFELMKALIEAGAAGVYFEDQLASETTRGPLGGRVLVPTSQFIRTLTAARLAADVLDVPTVLIARTDADSAQLLSSDIDPRDRPFITSGARTPEGFHRVRGGIDFAIARARACAPYADVLWYESSRPDLRAAEAFARAVHREFPGKILAYNCASSLDERAHRDASGLRAFQHALGELGYRFQFVTLEGSRALNHSASDLARAYATTDGTPAGARLPQAALDTEPADTSARYPREAGTGYFDEVAAAIAAGAVSTRARVRVWTGSTEFEPLACLPMD